MSTHQLLATKTTISSDTKTGLTTEQSQKLIQTMLTMSFGCLAFLRGLFPDESFVDQRFVPEKVEKNYKKCNGSQGNSIKIKTLVRGRSSEVDLLLNWLEKGVFQSIKLKYLKALSLGIFLNEDDPTDLLENYTFTFEYGSGDNFRMKIGSSEHDEAESISLLDSRKMAQQLMRRFIIITQSLEPLPQKKFLTLRLMFNENAPTSYQPHLFKDATYDKPAVVKVPQSTDSDSFTVGSLDTKHHKISLKVLSSAEYDTNMDPSEFLDIDPFDLIDQEPKQIPSDEGENNRYVNSQTTNILGDLLKSSQPNVQPTQAVRTNAEVVCECGQNCPPGSTSFRTCRECRKQVHGICYGNSNRVQKCLTCLYGPELDTESVDFKDLMMLRKCYRFIARTRNRSFPSSVSFFVSQLLGNVEIDKEIEERIAFCISTLFRDEVLAINNGNRASASQTNKSSSSSVINDWPGIKTPNQGELQQNREYVWSFCYNSPNAHQCYIDVLAVSRGQINAWLSDMREMKNDGLGSLPSSCDIQSLDITDTMTQERSPLGQKRKHVNLDQYLNEPSSSIANDTMDMRNVGAFETPKKIRKISVSKKSLRSAW